MVFASNLGSMPVIDDSNYRDYVEPPSGLATGYAARDFSRVPYGSLRFAKPRSRPKYPRSQWPDMIKRREEARATFRELFQSSDAVVLNQERTNFCWANAVIQAIHGKALHQGMKHIQFSSASVACPITGFRNVGNWGGTAVEYIAEHGVVPDSLWPNAAIDRKYDNAETQAIRKRYRVQEWDELRPGDFDELMSSLIDFALCPVGYNWWGHEVLAGDPIMFGRNDFGVAFLNSWDETWGEKGWGVLHESKATQDEGTALRQLRAWSE